jgi:hypothetical protein
MLLPTGSPRVDNDEEEDEVRAVALDVHRDFWEVAIVVEGRLWSAGRIETKTRGACSTWRRSSCPPRRPWGAGAGEPRQSRSRNQPGSQSGHPAGKDVHEVNHAGRSRWS